MPKVTLLKQRQMNNRISKLAGVKRAVRLKAEEIEAVAQGRLAMHRQEFQARIELTQGKTDCLVSLVDPAALSIEFGHYAGSRQLGEARTYVPGLNLFQGWRYKDGV